MRRELTRLAPVATVVAALAVASEKSDVSVKDVDFIYLISTSAMVFLRCREIPLRPVAVSLGDTPQNRPTAWTGNRNGTRSGSRYCADAAWGVR